MHTIYTQGIVQRKVYTFKRRKLTIFNELNRLWITVSAIQQPGVSFKEAHIEYTQNVVSYGLEGSLEWLYNIWRNIVHSSTTVYSPLWLLYALHPLPCIQTG
jgi:hypothetical protein